MPKLDWRPYFPKQEPRPGQVQALDWICEQFEAGHRRIICELGTGVGKSAVAVCVGAWLEAREKGQGAHAPGVTVLTSQLILQNQYVDDFKQARDLRAAANFKCSGPVAGTCGETSRVRKAVGQEMAQQSLKCVACPYREAKNDFIESPVGVTNYSYSLSESMYAGELPPRRLLVCDEAHNVEDEVRRWTSVELTDSELEKLGLSLPSSTWDDDKCVEWLDTVYRDALDRHLKQTASKLKKHVKAGTLATAAVKTLANSNDKFDKDLCKLNRLLNKGGRLLVSHDRNDRTHTESIRFQPLEIAGLIEEVLYSRASAVLLLSATLLDRDVFSKSVGLVGAPYLSIPSPFKDHAFGVRFRPVGKMTQAHIENTLRSYPKALRRILNENKGSKGIVHAMNYRIVRALKEAMGGEKRLLFQDSARDRDTLLKRHLHSPDDTVLVSPSMMEGLDLRDDLGRFQVICKVPYPDMSDPLVKHKDREWYSWRTVRTLVQAVGRSVRSETDWCISYILDECFVDVLDRAGHMVPRHLSANSLTLEEPF